MVKLVQDTLQLYNIKPVELKLLVSDAVSYMLAAGQIIKRKCNLKLIHVTCLGTIHYNVYNFFLIFGIPPFHNLIVLYRAVLK